jgi:hypothetical protein
MSIWGQPETYSDILQRTFRCTFFVGICCTALLAYASPEVRVLLSWIDLETEVGPIKGLKLLYVIVPGCLAVASRVIKLHDRISDLLGLRRTVDVQWILLPLARSVITDLDDARVLAIRLQRRKAMYEVFYPYVSLPDAKIDRQLVRTALDNYGWLWVIIEAMAILAVSILSLICMGATALALGALGLLIVLLLVAWGQWLSCRRSTSDEVSAILADDARKGDIRRYFLSI